jgi:NAD(P)-dependent dehydrogenase (short-subunit alcohol dehydrogenase family)
MQSNSEEEIEMELEGKRALVTGGTSGIGRAVAGQLARAGANVIVTGRDPGRGADVVAEIRSGGGEASFIAADIGDFAAIGRLAEEARAVDILINNAGAFDFAPTQNQELEGFQRMFDVNVRAPYFLTAALAPRMAAGEGGAIVNITTMAAELGLPGGSAYGATKAALASLTRTWATEFAAGGVRVNTVSPGPTRTEGVAQMSEEEVAFVSGVTAMGRLAEPSEIAELVVFLSSPRSSYMTGAMVAADGGATAVLG